MWYAPRLDGQGCEKIHKNQKEETMNYQVVILIVYLVIGLFLNKCSRTVLQQIDTTNRRTRPLMVIFLWPFLLLVLFLPSETAIKYISIFYPDLYQE